MRLPCIQTSDIRDQDQSHSVEYEKANPGLLVRSNTAVEAPGVKKISLSLLVVVSTFQLAKVMAGSTVPPPMTDTQFVFPDILQASLVAFAAGFAA